MPTIVEIEENIFEHTTLLAKVKTRLAVLEKIEIPLNLYISEKIMQNGFFPQRGNDILGVCILACKII